MRDSTGRLEPHERSEGLHFVSVQLAGRERALTICEKKLGRLKSQGSHDTGRSNMRVDGELQSCHDHAFAFLLM